MILQGRQQAFTYTTFEICLGNSEAVQQRAQDGKAAGSGGSKTGTHDGASGRVLCIFRVREVKLSMMGSRYASVFPLPVSAARITSLPFRISGIATTCISAHAKVTQQGAKMQNTKYPTANKTNHDSH
jgi:hypothetical protein